MSSSKRKLFTSIVSFALVAVIGVGAIIAVFAALVAHVDSGFNISYTASHVECTVTGTYSTKLGLKNQSLGAPIEFTKDDPDGQQKDFAPPANIEFASSEDYVEFHYTIQNNGANGFSVSLKLQDFNNPNFKVEYTKSARGTGNTNPQFNFDYSTETLADSYLFAKGSTKEYLDIGVRISMIGKPEVSASASGTFSFTLNGLAERPADLWDSDSRSFDKENIDLLLKQISNDATSSTTQLSAVNALAEQKLTAAAIKMFNVGKQYNSNIVVTLGGLTWHVCYLSKDKQGNAILTLWLTSSQQDAWKDRAADEGEYYGFLDGSLYSDWAANWSDTYVSDPYPSNMYGTSYVRAVTLNNGGKYAINTAELSTSYEKNRNSVFSLFTMEEFGLAKYLVTPQNVEWQEYGESARDIIHHGYDLSNENWSSDIEKLPSRFKSGASNYADKGEPNSTWKDDYLWLASMTETGTGNYKGLWQLETDQCKNGTLTGTSSVGQVGQISGSAYIYSWLRSPYYIEGKQLSSIEDKGSITYNTSDCTYAIRPALHLNLTKIAEALA